MRKINVYWRWFRITFNIKERVILGIALFGAIISILAITGLHFNWPPIVVGPSIVIGLATLLPGLWGIMQIPTKR